MKNLNINFLKKIKIYFKNIKDESKKNRIIMNVIKMMRKYQQKGIVTQLSDYKKADGRLKIKSRKRITQELKERRKYMQKLNIKVYE